MGNAFSHDPFRDVGTWDDLVRVNIGFLRGKVNATPYHRGPLEPDSIPLMGKLIALHENGMVTMEGQGGIVDGNIYQRSYVIGVLPRYHAAPLKRYLKAHRKAYAGRIWSIQSRPDGLLKLVLVYGDPRMNQPKRFNLTKVKRSNGTWGWPTNFPQSDNEDYRASGGNLESFHDYPNILDLLRGTLLVEVAGIAYGSGSVEDFLLAYFV